MALWRDRLAGQRAAGAGQRGRQRPGPALLPGAGGCLVLVTSRRHLTALDDATRVSLDTLPPARRPRCWSG